ncbi:MAG TPA: lyase family protein, partial [archaeon]|nr:lyase family protein [archaeon]
EPEYLTELIYSILSCYGVLANLADDMRHLQRSEINEVAEEFDSKQVGSSTMPHKRNPWNFENIKSMWKTFTPRMITVFMDQISEHQRDLSNSASQRFLPEIFFAITESTYRMNGLMKKLIVDKESMKKNFEMNKEMITAEPLYILLSLYGHEDAHEAVKQLTLKAQKLGQPLRELAFKDKELNPYLKKFTKKQLEIIQNPEKYIGESVKKTEQVCRQWKKELKI